MSEDNKQKGINIELSEEVAEGIYSNLAIITHSSSEFILDYIRIMPGVPKGKVKSRIVMTPEHAKKLLEHFLITYQSMKNLMVRLKKQIKYLQFH